MQASTEGEGQRNCTWRKGVPVWSMYMYTQLYIICVSFVLLFAIIGHKQSYSRSNRHHQTYPQKRKKIIIIIQLISTLRLLLKVTPCCFAHALLVGCSMEFDGHK